MKMKGIIAAVGLAVAASGATAAVLDFGNVGDFEGSDYFGSGSVLHSPGSFTDYLLFSLEKVGISAWNGLGTIADQPKVNGSNIIGLVVDLFTDVGADGDMSNDSLFANIGAGDYVTGGGLLPTGAYYFKIDGAASGPSASSYAYTASVSPVPEPGSYAMMLAGLGLMGLIATRRNSRER